jgi:REP element-mobilizing transposase RayT
MTATIYRHRLPHVRVDGAIYFVTWRVRIGQSELSEDERDCAAATIRHFDRDRYLLHAYVIMNDHVHVLVEPCPGFRLERIVQSWKSYTTNLMRRTGWRQNVVWQDEYFDRVVRNDAEYEQKRDYILHNPYQRWPNISSYRWCWAIGLDET